MSATRLWHTIGQDLNVTDPLFGGGQHLLLLQVPVRHVKSGQHATVALHPCHLPLQPSPATQQFSQPPHMSPSPSSLNAGGSIVHTSSTIHQQAPPPLVLQQQQEAQHHRQQQQLVPLQQQTEGSSLAQQQGMSGVSIAQQGTGGSSIAQQDSGAAPRALPAGLMSQALQRHSQTAEQAPWQQQEKDPFVLDHRIHCEAEDECAEQQRAAATAVACHACSHTVAPVTAPRPITQRDGSQFQASGSQSQAEAVQSSPALVGVVPSSPALAGPAPPNARKGMVLLDAAMHTRTVWEFQAVVVLLNGHWPPRGLLSGRWPPNPHTPDTVLPSSLPDSPLGECFEHF